MEITINARQVIALIWTVIAIVVSLIVVLAMGIPTLGYTAPPWWLTVAAFFAVFLVVTLPVYLLLALWGIATKSDND